MITQKYRVSHFLILGYQMAVVQGDPNQNFRFQMAVALSVFISDPMLVKLKCVWEAVVFCGKK